MKNLNSVDLTTQELFMFSGIMNLVKLLLSCMLETELLEN